MQISGDAGTWGALCSTVLPGVCGLSTRNSAARRSNSVDPALIEAGARSILANARCSRPRHVGQIVTRLRCCSGRRRTVNGRKMVVSAGGRGCAAVRLRSVTAPSSLPYGRRWLTPHAVGGVLRRLASLWPKLACVLVCVFSGSPEETPNPWVAVAPDRGKRGVQLPVFWAAAPASSL